jgi:hypothetical protein
MFRHMHLQWFSDPAAAPPGEPDEPQPGETQPAGTGEPQPAPKLTADGTWLSQANDHYKRSERFLADLLGKDSPRRCNSWSDVLDRMYGAEAQASEHQAKLDELQAKPGELEKAASAAGKPLDFKAEDLAKVVPGKLPDWMSSKQFKAYTEDLGFYLGDAAQEIRNLALELQIPADKAQRILDLFVQRHVTALQRGQQEYDRQRAAGLDALKKQWKGDFEANEELARRAVVTFGGEELVKRLALRGLENDDVVIHTFCSIGKLIGEGHLVPGRAGAAAQAVPGEKPTDAQRAAALKKRYGRSPELTGEGR